MKHCARLLRRCKATGETGAPLCVSFVFLACTLLGGLRNRQGLGMLVWEFTFFFQLVSRRAAPQRGQRLLQKGPRRSRPLYPLTGFPPLFPLSAGRPKDADGGGSG